MAHALRLALLLCFCSACVSTPKPGEEEALPMVFEDPSADDDGKDAPQFCNETGKKGDELAKCREQNRSIGAAYEEDAKKREPWYAFPAASWASAPEVPEDRVVPVKKEREAVAKLDQAAFAPLSTTELEFYTGGRAVPAGLQPFLVRGLLFYRQTGAFRVFQNDGAIFVKHDSLGHDATSETRSAVVVFLPQAPKHVYVDCSLIE